MKASLMTITNALELLSRHSDCFSSVYLHQANGNVAEVSRVAIQSRVVYGETSSMGWLMMPDEELTGISVEFREHELSIKPLWEAIDILGRRRTK